MIEIIENIIDIVVQFINGIFDFKVEFWEGTQVSVGLIVCAFVLLVVSIYIILKTLKVIGDEK